MSFIKKIFKRKNSNDLKIDKNTFRPIKSLEGKSNYKRHFRIERDGSIKERIFLNVPDISLREEIICKHLLSFLVRTFIQNIVGVKFISRDKPWDFGIELSNGQSFNVEITSVADNDWLHEKMKREEVFEEIVIQKKIKLRELKKIHLWFGGEVSGAAIKKAEEKFIKADEFIVNSFFGGKTRLYVSDSKDEDKSLATLILEAIERKNNKGHKDKEKTILIIDNRTSRFGLEDYQRAVDELCTGLDKIPFPEIYFYTGYYSDNDSSNAEYSFAPIKLSEDKYNQLKNKIDSGDLALDKNGIIYD